MPDEKAQAANEWQTDGCASPRSPKMVTHGGSTFPENDPAVHAVIAEVQAAGAGRFAQVFAGVEMVPEQVRAIVYRKPSAEFDAYIRQAAGDECVIVRDAAYSQAELTTLAQRITDDMAYWKERGIPINTVGPKHDGSGVTVGTEQVVAAGTELPKRYGTAIPIKVEKMGPVVPLPAKPAK